MAMSPLRLWLQSASLLAVLAGYGLLLLLHQGLAAYQRLGAHQSLVAQLALPLQAQAGSRSSLQALVAGPTLPGLRLRLLKAPPPRSETPRLVPAAGQEWLVSVAPLLLPDGRRAWLKVEQNVTESLRQERLASALLLAAAGVSSLFTSALLRLVLRRGLVQPLGQFGAQLQSVQAPPTPGDLIAVDQQPQELQPIALAFNDLQERLATSWERQRAFVDGVAHELRTPITLISGHAESLLRHGPSPAAAPPLRLIELEARRMGTLVSDLLDLARQDSGRLSLRCQTIVADDVLLEALERLGPAAQGRLRLAMVGADAPALPLALGDPDRLQQCLAALVDNALRYSPAPCPVALGASAGPQGQLVLHVRDAGPGVEPAERERIFGRFVRGSAALQAQVRGSGIGLSVVKLLMEAMGGAVQVAEAPGGGADFQLHLRSLRASEPAP